jgi:hypothetical protein
MTARHVAAARRVRLSCMLAVGAPRPALLREERNAHDPRLQLQPGPATLPESVLRQAADEMLDWHGSGMSVMEMSHAARSSSHPREAEACCAS